MTGPQFQRAVFQSIRTIRSDCKIDMEVPVPYKHIYFREDQKTKLEIWCFKQDIAIYKPLFDKSVPKREAKIIAYDKSEIQIILEKDTAQKTKDVGLPYVIIETKKEQPNVHEVLAYSQKAEMIKTIFPYCKFVFCIYGNISPRTYRHGIAFDRITSIADVRDKREMQNFKREITKLIKEAEKDLRKISRSRKRIKR